MPYYIGILKKLDNGTIITIVKMKSKPYTLSSHPWFLAFLLSAGLDEAQAGIKIAGKNINNPRYADDTTLMAESEEELKSLLMKVRVKMLA